MPVGEKQRLITDIISTVIQEKPQNDKNFEWFINKHTKEHFREHFDTIDNIFKSLNGNLNINESKRAMSLQCDAYFSESKFIFEFDEFQHFSSARLKTFEHYPTTLNVNYSFDSWKEYCKVHKQKADKYRFTKTAVDFNFPGGRTCQRAYLDCFRDLLPKQYGLRPTLRINEFEVFGIYSNNKEACNKIEKLIKDKLIY